MGVGVFARRLAERIKRPIPPELDRIASLTADLALPSSRYQTDGQRALFHQRALEKLETLPGVRSAGLISSLPLKAQVWGDTISKEGDTRPRAERRQLPSRTT